MLKWVGLGWMDENRPTSNSALPSIAVFVDVSYHYYYNISLGKDG